MSFGYSTSDAVILVQLAWNTVQNSRKAVGEHDELTREASTLHAVLRRLKSELASPGSPINRPGDTCREELESIVAGCSNVLGTLDSILAKHNSLATKERSGKKLWHRWLFGNKLVLVQDLRGKLCYYTSAIALFLNMVSNGTIGRVEQQMDSAGGELREIRIAVNRIASAYEDDSILTVYSDDDPAVWREIRRELVKDGFTSRVIEQYKDIIQAYIRELGSSPGIPDQNSWGNQAPQVHTTSNEAYILDAGSQPYIQTHRPRVHGQYTETIYDGDLGLGSLLVDTIPPDAATDKPHTSDVKCPSTTESRLIFRETVLPLEIHQSPSEQQRHRPRGSQALVEYYCGAPFPQSSRQNKAQSSASASASPRSKGVKPRVRPRSPETARRLLADQNEKKRRRNKNMTRLFFGSVVVAHVLISLYEWMPIEEETSGTIIIEGI